jgi:hypothetical protein
MAGSGCYILFQMYRENLLFSNVKHSLSLSASGRILCTQIVKLIFIVDGLNLLFGSHAVISNIFQNSMELNSSLM